MKTREPILLAAVLIVVSPSAALAYLDPGTASMILQGILGGVAAGYMVLKLGWTRIKSFFSGKGPVTDKDRQPR